MAGDEVETSFVVNGIGGLMTVDDFRTLASFHDEKPLFRFRKPLLYPFELRKRSQGELGSQVISFMAALQDQVRR